MCGTKLKCRFFPQIIIWPWSLWLDSGSDQSHRWSGRDSCGTSHFGRGNWGIFQSSIDLQLCSLEILCSKTHNTYHNLQGHTTTKCSKEDHSILSLSVCSQKYLQIMLTLSLSEPNSMGKKSQFSQQALATKWSEQNSFSVAVW